MAQFTLGPPAGTPGVTPTNTRSSNDPNRGVYREEDKLRNLVIEAEARWKQINQATLRGASQFNKALATLNKQMERYKISKEMTPTAANLKIDPVLQRHFASLKARSTKLEASMRDVASISIALEKSIEKLSKSAKGKDSFIGAFTSLGDSIKKGTELLQSDTSKYSKVIVDTLRSVIAKAAEEAARNASYIPKFKLGKTGQVRPGGLTSMSQFYSQIPTNRALTTGGQNFTLGAWGPPQPGVSRAESTTFRMLEKYQHPGAGIGAHGGLPVPLAGGGGRGGPPIIAQYRNLPVPAGNNLPVPYNYPVGPYTGQNVFARRMRGTGWPTTGGGSPWGAIGGAIGTAMGVGGAVVGGLLDAGTIAWDLNKRGNKFIQPASSPLNESYRAAMIAGIAPRDFRHSFNTNKGLGVSDMWQRLGFTSLTDLSQASQAYGSRFQSKNTLLNSALLSQGPNTAAMNVGDWQQFYGKITGMGMSLGAGDVDKTKQILTDSFEKGAKKALPSPQIFENMNRVLDVIANTGSIMTVKEMADLAVSGAGSALPNVRNASSVISELAAYDQSSKNIMGGTGFNLTSIFSAAARMEGSSNLTAKQWQDFFNKEGINYTINEDTAKRINANRSLPGASMMMAWDMMSHRGLPSTALPTIRNRETVEQLMKAGFSRTAAEDMVGFSVTEPGAKTGYWNRVMKGGPAVTGLKPGGKDTVAEPVILGTPGFAAWKPFKYGEVRERGKFTPPGVTLPGGGELAGGETGKTRAAEGSYAGLNVDKANTALNTLGNTLIAVNRAFDEMFNKINRFVGGDKIPGKTG